MTSLPDPHQPFPIKHPYIVRSDMYKQDNPLYGYDESDLFIVDSDFPDVIAVCLNMLKDHPQVARVYLEDDIHGLEAALWQVAVCFAADKPQYASLVDETYTSHLTGLSLERGGNVHFDPSAAMFPDTGAACYDHLRTCNRFDRLCDLLRLTIQEDIVIGRVTPDLSADVMECMLVPIPSKWNPQEKTGLSFAEVHMPIPNSERLVAASPNLVNAIMTKGDFVRYNWTIATSRRERNPAIAGGYQQEIQLRDTINDYETMLTDVYLRVERQTLRAFPDLNRYVFIIHTYLHPLKAMLTTDERKQQLLRVLLSMGDDIREERGLSSVVYRHLSAHLNG